MVVAGCNPGDSCATTSDLVARGGPAKLFGGVQASARMVTCSSAVSAFAASPTVKAVAIRQARGAAGRRGEAEGLDLLVGVFSQAW